MQFKMITPQLATRMLLKNIINRTIYEHTVEKYALDMKRGRWAPTHQGICFDDQGNLTDGQHRLHAIVRSGKTIGLTVVSGIPETFIVNDDGKETPYRTQLVFDGGKLRGLGDQLNINFDMKNANLKAAIIRTIIEICTKKTGLALSTITVKTVYDFYEQEIEAVVDARKSVPGLITAGALGAMTFAAKCFKDEVLVFEKSYFTGVDLSQGSPILTFRNYMLNRTKGMGFSAINKRSIVLYCFNSLKYHILKEPLKRLATTHQGLDFFMNKQKKIVTDIIELIYL